MAPSPVVTATIQAAIIGAVSNILAQAISAQKYDVRSKQSPVRKKRGATPFTIDWVPVVQFLIYGAISTPPNFMWQEFLESTFPASHPAPTSSAIASAAAGDEKALDRSALEGRLVEPKLNKANTFIKTVLDQTLGSAVNTIAFIVFMHAVRAGMEHRDVGSAGSWAFLTSGDTIRYDAIRWVVVWERARAEVWGIMRASWAFWPFVSLLNFGLLKTVAARNLAASLAGVAWGVYMSLVAARES
ncbi:hypothetical protein B0T17DRAFT_398337 [Bombardia bombarda]|uniref:Mpv17/PMP22 family protein n=1 Tax=Bombardia bombarda TaxID=252184 RepID=A0AA39WBT9_9PEZI|nr:hypothetical protein B0T17DRAFT_398337 [Bombardia bombarda]